MTENGQSYDSPAFIALADILRDAKRGEVRLPPMSEETPAEPQEHDGGLPASWYRREAAEAPDFNRDLLRAGGFGVLAGFAILAPLLWWQSNGPTAVHVLSSDEGTPQLTFAVTQRHDVSVSTTALAPQDRMRVLIELARIRIMSGDVLAARTMLSRADVARDADALFLMAETYDPRRLAAWRAKGVDSDAQRARALYAAANALGHSEADERLATLD